MAVRLTIDGVEATSYNIPEHKRGTTFGGLAFIISVNGSTNIADASIVLDVEGNIYSTANGKIVITDAANGRFQISKQIIDLPARNYYYEITITFGNGDIKQYISGHWNITE